MIIMQSVNSDEINRLSLTQRNLTMDLATAFGIKPGEVVSLVGGGGKSTAMFSLGAQLATQGKRVLLTTTTRIGLEQLDLAPAQLTFNPATESLSALMTRLQQAVDRAGQVLLISGVDKHQGKALGIPPETIDALSRDGVFDAIIIEADGSKKRPFKAPASYEPVLPTSTTLVVPVFGLDVLGQPLNETMVHRVAEVSRLSGAELGTPVTVEIVAAVLTHPAGGLKAVPPTARVIPLLNKLDQVDPDEAESLADSLLCHSRIEAVVLGSINRENGTIRLKNRVVAIVLAAGQASRFGSPKQLALWQGKPLLAHAVDAALASQVERVVVVLGANAANCRAVIADKPVEIIVNERWAAGQSTSMKAGLAALPKTAQAAVFLLADQPRVTAAVINAVVAAYHQSRAPLVWPEYAGKRGNPVLFDRTLFAEMQQITGDTGARPVLQSHRHQAVRVPVADPGILHDVDRPTDLG